MIALFAVIASSLDGSLSPPPFVAVMLVKATLLLATGGLAAAIARRAGAATRHAIWAITLAGALGLPLAMIALPAWGVRALPHSVQQENGTQTGALPNAATGPVSRAFETNDRTATALPHQPSPRAASSHSGAVWTISRLASASLPLWLPLAWLLGAVGMLSWMVIGRFGLRRVARRADTLDAAEWRSLLEEERARAGVDKAVQLLSSPMVTTPLTWGIGSPVILLPAESGDWSHEHRAVVLRHELAHIARGDSLVQILAGTTCAIYWFHPLVWFAIGRLRAEQERACDDRVLASGTPPTEYAAHLLEVARSARALGAHGLVSLAMARPSQLEGRLLAVLSGSRRRSTVSPTARLAGFGAALIVFVALSAFRPLPRASALQSAVLPTIIATQFVPTASPIAAEAATTSKLDRGADAKAGFDSVLEKSVDVKPGETLVLDLETGAGLTITGWDQSRVRVRGTLGGRNWRDTEVRLERTDSGVRLVTRYEGRSTSHSTSHHFDIQVPRHFNVRISSGGGGISISGVDGVFTGTTGGGTIRIEKANGRAEISTGGGTVRVNDSNLSGSVSTGGGTVVIQNVRGGLRGHSGSSTAVYINSGVAKSDDANTLIRAGGSGETIDDEKGGVRVSGPRANITIDESTGEIRNLATGRVIYRKAGGRISVAEAMHGADVRTGGGAISIGRSAGDVRASTGGGDISIGPLDGSAEAHTGAGDVTLNLRGAGKHSVDVTSGNGRVLVVLPAGFSGVLDLETAYTNSLGRPTRIESDWPVSTTESSEWDDTQGTPRKYVRARARIGGGTAVVRVRTVNGDVVVRRER
jgi:beta-lactamase regulating signal transducer with metallopeptidase domain